MEKLYRYTLGCLFPFWHSLSQYFYALQSTASICAGLRSDKLFFCVKLAKSKLPPSLLEMCHSCVLVPFKRLVEVVILIYNRNIV